LARGTLDDSDFYGTIVKLSRYSSVARHTVWETLVHEINVMDKILCNMSEYIAKITQLPATPVIINFDQLLEAT